MSSWSPTVEAGWKVNWTERTSGVWEVTEGQIEEEEGGCWCLNIWCIGPQQCFCAPTSFISSGWKVLSDSGGGTLLFRGARGSSSSGFSFKVLQHKSIGDNQAWEHGGFFYQLPEQSTGPGGKRSGDTVLHERTCLSSLSVPARRANFLLNDKKRLRSGPQNWTFLLSSRTLEPFYQPGGSLKSSSHLKSWLASCQSCWQWNLVLICQLSALASSYMTAEFLWFKVQILRFSRSTQSHFKVIWWQIFY